MTTFYFSHEDCKKHQQNDNHPECPERLDAAFKAAQSIAGIEFVNAEAAEKEFLLLAHSKQHIETVFDTIPLEGLNFLDNDTAVCKHSGMAALLAAGASKMAVDYVLAQKGSNAFCAVRPPGHHAHRSYAAGFCLFNNVALGARYALQNAAIKKVAIVDFDVHHGDGTQDIVWDDAGIFFASMHQYPLYPMTGQESERGVHDNVMNFPLPYGTNGEVAVHIMDSKIIPALRDFAPDFIFLSAGFDAHVSDPLAGLSFENEDFYYMTQSLKNLADEICEGRMVAVLEGGYNLKAVEDGTKAVLTALKGLRYDL